MTQTVAILALQGAFLEHKNRLEQLGCQCVELRKKSDLEIPFDRLVLPGGESTVQRKLLTELEMLVPLQQSIESGLPVLGTCAGLILLASQIENGKEGDQTGKPGSSKQEPSVFGTLPIVVRRNAYGRQLSSFHTQSKISESRSIPLTFIRAPLITDIQEDVDILVRVEQDIVGVRYGNQIGVSFHPELDDDDYIYQLFLDMS